MTERRLVGHISGKRLVRVVTDGSAGKGVGEGPLGVAALVSHNLLSAGRRVDFEEDRRYRGISYITEIEDTSRCTYPSIVRERRQDWDQGRSFSTTGSSISH